MICQTRWKIIEHSSQRGRVFWYIFDCWYSEFAAYTIKAFTNNKSEYANDFFPSLISTGSQGFYAYLEYVDT